MVLCGVLAGFLILSTAGFIDQGLAQTLCTTDGWFGTNCQYQCHCANSAPCDKVDGSCNSSCHSDWFGPACQYTQATFTSSAPWLTDNSDTSCNPGDFHSADVVLNIAIPLTWVRVVVNDAVYLNQIQLTYQVTTTSAFQACTDPRTAKVDNVTLDIYCSTDTPVSRVTLSGLGVTKLCSLYISGGRNVALNQQAQQSSRLDPWDPNPYLAKNAVDGRVGDADIASAMSTCSHTDLGDNEKRWTVSFTRAVDVIRFLIHNRIDCCGDRLVGFTLTAKPEPSSSNTPYTYTDPGSTAEDFYTDVPSPKINFPVSQVQIEAEPIRDFLTLCEVVVFGESRCPANTFGLACERQCNCVSGGRSCFIHNGGCPDGCATNYAGEDCLDCAVGKYGVDCGTDCSVNCGGDTSCDRPTGVCTHGCDPGFTGDRCVNECDAGWYGAGCLSSCNTNCSGSDNACNHVTGVCDSCPPGKYRPDCSGVCSVYCAGPNNACDRDVGVCNDGCDPGHWGYLCLDDCSKACAGPDNACDRLSGACVSCDPGLYGDKCQFSCSSNCGGSDKTCEQFDGRCSVCPPEYYGNKCTGVCSSNCAGTTCDRDTGACLSCSPGRYGTDCLSVCNDNCGGSSNKCNILSGDCEEGCYPGYRGEKCDQICNDGWYGAGCSNRCNTNCAGSDNACDHVTGVCDSCPSGRYGPDCSMTCSGNCGESDKTCDRVSGRCDSCLPGYHGERCNHVCPRGQYGLGCGYNCSDQCAGPDRLCHHVDGMCYFGCVQDDQSPMCRGFQALHQQEESEGSSLNVSGIAVTIVAVAVAVVAVVMGFLAWRFYKVSKERPSTPANKDFEEEGSPQQAGNKPSSTQQTLSTEDKPNQSYVPVEVDPEDVHVYNEGFDHYDSPLDLMRKSGEYDIPRPVAVSASNEDYVEPRNVLATTSRNAEGAAYVNTAQ